MGDGPPFEAWYEREHPRVFVAMLAMTGNRDLAADVTDEAFARALQHWRRVGAMTSPGGWTYRVAVNLAHRRARRAHLEQRLLRHLRPPEPLEQSTGEVWTLVRALPERQRLAVVLRYIADLTEPDIAQVMNVTRGTVAATLAAARRSLGNALEEPVEEQQ